MSQTADLLVQIERLTQENARLRTENLALRPLVSELQHKVRILERLPAATPAQPKTDALIRKGRLHG
jgi:regulator of replication initiation timing